MDCIFLDSQTDSGLLFSYVGEDNYRKERSAQDFNQFFRIFRHPKNYGGGENFSLNKAFFSNEQ